MYFQLFAAILANLMQAEKTTDCIVSDKMDECDQCKEILEELENIDDDCDRYGITFVKTQVGSLSD